MHYINVQYYSSDHFEITVHGAETATLTIQICKSASQKKLWISADFVWEGDAYCNTFIVWKQHCYCTLGHIQIIGGCNDSNVYQ